MVTAVWVFMRDNALAILLTISAAYLLGSVNFAILVSRWFSKRDIRSQGSGNAGTTNVLRTMGVGPAVITTVGDIGKAVAAVFIGQMIFTYFGNEFFPVEARTIFGEYIAGFFCMLGHIFPLYFAFKGGKGVMTAAGMFLAIDWRVFLVELILFAIVFLITRIVSAGSIIGSALIPIVTFCFVYFIDYRGFYSGAPDHLPFSTVVVPTMMSVLIAALIIFMHRDNIKRIFKGEEKRIKIFKRKGRA